MTYSDRGGAALLCTGKGFLGGRRDTLQKRDLLGANRKFHLIRGLNELRSHFEIASSKARIAPKARRIMLQNG